MADTKRLAFSIIQFLHTELGSGNLSADAQESLEVAVQCLETAFGVSADDRALAVAETLPEIFASATLQTPDAETETPQVEADPLRHEPTQEELARAEKLKSEGNEEMKQENFGAAVGFYSRAIKINPENAVYFCNRAAAYSKMGNYAGAVTDCERAIVIDPTYSKAYGRMGLALASLNRHAEAVGYYRRALELDPENDTYRSNLKIAEQKMKETPSPTGGVDLAGFLSNPNFMSMAANLMNNPQVQQMMSGMMSGMYSSQGSGATPGTPGSNDLSGLIQAGQDFAQQMQQQNPELIEELRSHIRSRPPSASQEEQ
ncbi:small glutamine-rich tetratricopeptide repeat-containing protein alpha-like isoform X1 [Conger conger]|uniref:small glutamine-rich tetratricopeptide repeat-containing protein alpha-like isoform X1 n=2 Tax=Conger conger TaxID=82655 RepID=UPI002A5A288B|nr:small glutamine-rich tetratricopeptide repeat-containing protein alpha-like isoform X1 [Conger conger]XP_061099417.1 small glutamine-rich tetratricopeptide repeat-containing protein alpha-like isoform X1 [Conger conger]